MFNASMTFDLGDDVNALRNWWYGTSAASVVLPRGRISSDAILLPLIVHFQQ